MQHNEQLNILSSKNLEISFNTDIVSLFHDSNDVDKVAVIATTEYEGIFRNGGVGTYCKTLSQQLHLEGWYVILLLYYTEQCFAGTSHFVEVNHIFSTAETQNILSIQPVHRSTLCNISDDELSYQSYCGFLYLQALAKQFKNSRIYIEFCEMLGIGYYPIRSKYSNHFGLNFVMGVTMHSGQEWIYEANQWYAQKYPPMWFEKVCDYEQYSFENADLAFFPSYYLKSRVQSYGWKTKHAQHMPNFVPIVQKNTIKDLNVSSSKIPLVFFGRLEMRKGICTFVEAIQMLDAQTRQKIEVYFIGKVVKLGAQNTEDLQSDQYIESQLKDIVDFSILSTLSSAKAIEFISSLSHAIVCLASVQENFPNAAMEMGQLPFPLVISDTGGFRETLSWVKRSEGIYWFKTGYVDSLSQMLSKAIASYPEIFEVTSREDLLKINQNLLERKLSIVEDAFIGQKITQQLQAKVTIGITCYNLGAYLIECLASVEAQSYPNLEVIVFDDASCEQETQEQIRHAQSLFPNYQFICSERNLGLGGARNRLIDLATGEYFLPLDADNLLLPFAVEKFIDVAQQSQAVAVISPMLQFGLENRVHSYHICSIPFLLNNNNIGDACSLFSTDLLRKFKHPERKDCSTHDWCVFAAAIATGEKVAHYNYPLYKYRVRPNSMIKGAYYPKERYYVLQYLAQISPQQWSPRQLYLLMRAIQQLQAQSEYGEKERVALLTKIDHLSNALEQSQKLSQSIQVIPEQTQIQTNQELEQLRDQVQAMNSSKFWKIRKGWFKLKQILRIPLNERY